MISSNVMGYSIISLYALSYGISHLISLPPAPKSVQEFDIQPAIISFLQMVVCSVVFYIYHSKGSLLDTFTQLSSIPTHIYVKLAFLSFAYSGNILVQSFLRDDRYKQSINTIRGGTILMNAIILAILCGRKYVKIQWIAILIQVAVVLMVRNEDFIILFQNSPIFHILMIVSVFVTAVCASAFDSLTKANFNIPLMTINMIFFGFGFCFNMMAAMISVFISNSTWTTSRIYWFETVCVMVNGIMSTFIYKYFDSVAESLIQQSMGIVLVNHTYVNVNDIIGYVIILGTINLFVSESKKHHSLSSKRLEEIESDIIQGSVRIKSGARSGKKSVAFRYLKYFIGFLLTVLFVVLMIGMLAYYGIQLNHLKANKLSELSTYQRHKMDITRHADKVAVCVVGELRTFRIPSVHTSIFNYTESLSERNANYFFHIEDSGGCDFEEVYDQSYTLEDAIGIFNPKVLSYKQPSCSEPRISESSCCQKSIKHSRHWISYARKVSCFNSVKQYELDNNFTYDWYVFIRPDLYFFEESQMVVSRLNPGRMYISSKERNQPLGDYIYVVPSQLSDLFIHSIVHHNHDAQCRPLYPPEFFLNTYIHFTSLLPHQLMPIFFTIARCWGGADCKRLKNEVFSQIDLSGNGLLPNKYCEWIFLQDIRTLRNLV